MTNRKKPQPNQARAGDPAFGPETFRLIVDASPTPMIAVAEDGTIVLVNRAAERLLKSGGSELIGEVVESLLPEGLQHVHESHRSDYTQEPHIRAMGNDRDLMVKAGDGSIIPVEIGLSPIQSSRGLLILCTLVDIRTRTEASATQAKAAARLERTNRRLSLEVATDSLTGLRSRQAFLDQLSAQIQVSVRNARPISVLILDIDFFKGYNDQFGHLEGDKVLERLGEVLGQAARRSDVLARLGGEEFGILLPETDTKGALTFAERFRKGVETSEWPLRDITVSVGATTAAFHDRVPRPEPPSVSDLLAQADQALYRSKDEGRNRVTHFAAMAQGE